MFKFQKEGAPLRWPVQVVEPADMGLVKKSDFTAQFVMISRSEFERLSNTTDKELMKVVLVGWTGVQDQDGNELPFNDENRDLLADMPPVINALARAYLSFMAGAPAKN